MNAAAAQPWATDIYQRFRDAGVTQIGYVPDAGHRSLIDLAIADDDMHAISLTTEEEGIGVAAGADLGGARFVLLMQSSGVGNCINFLSLMKGGKFPLLALVSMRGDYGEGNPWQYPMGQATETVLNAMGVICLRADTADEFKDAVASASTMAYQAGNAVAVLMTQKLLGAKVF